jgi:nucleoside 2-deoxyribosyltransferase
MSFKVYLSYSVDPEEQAIVWRLQTLAAAHGIQIYVPQRQLPRTTSRSPVLLPDAAKNAIDRADCVVAILTSRTGPAVDRELSYALGREKVIIPIVQENVADAPVLKKFATIFKISPRDPGKTETEVVKFLRQQKVSKEGLQIVGAVVAIGLGLLLLSTVTQE